MSTIVKPSDPLTIKELKAVALVVQDYARGHGEDLIGAILKSGAFHALGDGDSAVVDLADKLDHILKQ